MASFVITNTCGNCGACEQCGVASHPAYTMADRRMMAAAQRATMMDRCNYYANDADLQACSGASDREKMKFYKPICCGLDHATGGARASTRTAQIGGVGADSFKHTRALRLPLEMAVIDPVEGSVYELTHVKGLPSLYVKFYRQIGPAEIGPSGVVVRVEEVGI